MAENFARLLLYTSVEFYAEKDNSERIIFLEAAFTDEEIPEEALSKKAQEQWGVLPEGLHLLCILPKSSTEFIHYYGCKSWGGSFEEANAEEIVALGFNEMTELSEKNDILAVEVLEKSILGKDFKKQSTIITSQAAREVDEQVDDILSQKRKPIELKHETTDDFEIMPAVPKGQGRKQEEPTREGIDYEIMSRGSAAKKQESDAELERKRKVQKSVFSQY